MKDERSRLETQSKQYYDDLQELKRENGKKIAELQTQVAQQERTLRGQNEQVESLHSQLKLSQQQIGHEVRKATNLMRDHGRVCSSFESRPA